MKSISRPFVPALGVLMTALLVAGCTRNETILGDDHLTGSGVIVTQVRTPGSFSGIRVTNYATVVITQDSVESLRIEADDNIIDRVTTSVSAGNLVVGLKEGSYGKVTVNVYASMKTVRLLESTGAAQFSSFGPIHTDDLICGITGAGSITLSGTATRQTIEIAGAGDVRNFNLVSSMCHATITGSGNIEVYVTQQLDAVITGAGSIVYAGNPPLVGQTITGVGSVRPKP